MDIFTGIDLGSTTTKAVLIREDGSRIGRGITNSRSNYDVACAIAREEAFVQARFALIRERLEREEALDAVAKPLLSSLARHFRLQLHLEQIRRLGEALHRAMDAPRHESYRTDLAAHVDSILDGMTAKAPEYFGELAIRKSDFFRDIAAADYMRLAETETGSNGIPFETLAGLFDTAILQVENSASDHFFEQHIGEAFDRTIEKASVAVREKKVLLKAAVDEALREELNEVVSVGTGYGRQRLPFPREQIRSEILCHGLGAHVMFPATRTVLDIGGQDTKAIQVDERGIVTSFQMNDRCAAGCGRYLGYIADEMNLGLHELGPLAQKSRCVVKINSTCTVFAGAELRERLSLGQKREDILAGLHRAIILRAMSLLARSGGVENEFTFTGGVARNPAAVSALEKLIAENYGDRVINISAESIYTGALGAALFARRSVEVTA